MCYIYLFFRGNHTRLISRPLVRRIWLLWPYVTIRSFPISAASCGTCAADADCPIWVFSVWFIPSGCKEKGGRGGESSQRKGRKRCLNFKLFLFFAVFIESLGSDQDWELPKRLLGDSVMMTLASSEGCDWNGLCVTWFNTDRCLSKHKTHTSECEGSIWKYLLPAWNIDFYPCCFLIMPGSRAVEEAVGGGGRGEAEADICAC